MEYTIYIDCKPTSPAGVRACKNRAEVKALLLSVGARRAFVTSDNGAWDVRFTNADRLQWVTV